MSKKIYYELIVWACDHKDDHLLPRDLEFISIDNNQAVKEAIALMELNHQEGWEDSYVTIKKRCSETLEELDEYSNESLDCSPLEDLPKYIQKRIQPLIKLQNI